LIRVRPTLVRAAHVTALALAVLAVALSLRESALFLPLVVVAVGAFVSLFVEWASVPLSLRRVLPRVHALALLAAGLTAWLSRSLSILILEPEAIPLVAAPLLVPVWAAFALAPRAFPSGRTLVPGVVAVLVFAGLNPAPEGWGGSLLPFPKDGSRNGFSEVYLALAILVLAALWVAALGGSGPRWSRRMVVTVVLTGVFTAALAATAIIGLPLAQPHVERAFADALAQGTTGLSGESTLGDIGTLARSRRRVLDLQTPLRSGGQWRLPSEVFTRFDGRTWSSPALPAQPRSPGPAARRALRPGPPPQEASPVVTGLGNWFPLPRASDEIYSDRMEPEVQIRITQAEVTDWPLLLPRDPTAVTANASVLDLDRFGLVRRPAGLPLRQYGAVLASPRSASPPPDAGLSGAGVEDLSPAEREESLSLPESVDPRIASLAVSLRPPSTGPRETLDATVLHLQTHYRYSLSPGPFRPDGDPLAEFLFEKEEAYCEYFASAAVVLLRLQGVPARYVKGLSVGPQTDMGGGLHVVRESDAHAWIEAWIPGQGWVEADPTPPGQFAGARGTPGSTQRWLQHARAALAGAWARFVEGGPLAFLRWLGGEALSLATRAVREPRAWLVLVALAFGPAAWRRLRALLARRRVARDRQAEAALVPADLRALLRELERRWSAHGHPRLRTRGLLEHASALARSSPSGAAETPVPSREVDTEIVRAYYAARFGGGEAPPRDRLRQLREAIRMKQ
jgi:transglutaminase-like putative cysteine protease